MLLKTHFIEQVIARAHIARPRILELGCGTARHISPLLRAHPEYTYVGVEPFLPSFAKAREAVASLPNVTLCNQLAYGAIPDIEDESCDIVFSLSALEHVKDLESFIRLSARYARKGALVVHRYDLGHALHPGSLKERVQVWIGNTFPALLPEHRFVRYVPQQEVESHIQKAGCRVEDVTYHDMPNHRAFAKCADTDESLSPATKALLEWEYTYGPVFSKVPTHVRERLFPAVAVWARKM
jgi:SAM-dependent methyltransferase